MTWATPSSGVCTLHCSADYRVLAVAVRSRNRSRVLERPAQRRNGASPIHSSNDKSRVGLKSQAKRLTSKTRRRQELIYFGCAGGRRGPLSSQLVGPLVVGSNKKRRPDEKKSIPPLPIDVAELLCVSLASSRNYSTYRDVVRGIATPHWNAAATAALADLHRR